MTIHAELEIIDDQRSLSECLAAKMTCQSVSGEIIKCIYDMLVCCSSVHTLCAISLVCNMKNFEPRFLAAALILMIKRAFGHRLSGSL